MLIIVFFCVIFISAWPVFSDSKRPRTDNQFGPSFQEEPGTAITDAKSQGNIYILQNEENMKLANATTYMRNIRNTIYFEDSKSMVYYNTSEKSWNQYYFPQNHTIKTHPEMISISECMYCGTSGGCSIKNSYTRSLTIQDSFSLLAFGQIYTIFGLAYSISSVQRFVLTEYIQCDFKQNQFAQIYIAPRYIEVEETSVKQVVFKKVKGLSYKTKNGRRFQKVRFLINEQPNHWCYIRDSKKTARL
jgi:hypothetical protein